MSLVLAANARVNGYTSPCHHEKVDLLGHAAASRRCGVMVISNCWAQARLATSVALALMACSAAAEAQTAQRRRHRRADQAQA